MSRPVTPPTVSTATTTNNATNTTNTNSSHPNDAHTPTVPSRPRLTSSSSGVAHKPLPPPPAHLPDIYNTQPQSSIFDIHSQRSPSPLHTANGQDSPNRNSLTPIPEAVKVHIISRRICCC